MFGRCNRQHFDTVVILESLQEQAPNFCRVDGARLTIRDVPAGYDEYDGHEKRSRWLACVNWTGTTFIKPNSHAFYGHQIARPVDCNGRFIKPVGALDYSAVDYLTCEPETYR